MRKVKLNKDRCVSCHTCEVACAEKHGKGGSIEDVYYEIPVPLSRLHIVLRKAKLHLRKCVHCKKPKCIEACEEGAITKQDDGVVVIDEEKALKWLRQGAQPTPTTARLLSKAGIMDKHKTPKEKS